VRVPVESVLRTYASHEAHPRARSDDIVRAISAKSLRRLRFTRAARVRGNVTRKRVRHVRPKAAAGLPSRIYESRGEDLSTFRTPTTAIITILTAAMTTRSLLWQTGPVHVPHAVHRAVAGVLADERARRHLFVPVDDDEAERECTRDGENTPGTRRPRARINRMYRRTAR